ncbi:MAG: nucleotidyltransferase family protein [Pseudomonadales bacterium]
MDELWSDATGCAIIAALVDPLLFNRIETNIHGKHGTPYLLQAAAMTEVSSDRLIRAIVLAGDRGPNDPLVERFDAGGCKALLEVNGVAMLERVLDALQHARCIQGIAIVGPPQEQLARNSTVCTLVQEEVIDWHPPLATPSRSAFQVLETFAADQPALLTTADHPLLTATIIDNFCTASVVQGADVCVGLAPYELVQKVVPNMCKTVLRFKDGEYCGCNLFAFLTPKGRDAAQQWQQVEQQRKSPLRVARLLGWKAVCQYALGQLTLAGALAGLSKRLGLRVSAVLLEDAHAAIDVDSIDDYELVQQMFAAQSVAR